MINERDRGDGGLVIIDTSTATTTRVARFAPGSPDDLLCEQLRLGNPEDCIENGGLSVHPHTGGIWAVESGFSNTPRIFRVDPLTGLAIPPVLRLGLNGAPILGVGFGFDALEILGDGRFIAFSGAGANELYEINPVPDPQSGLAEVTLIPLNIDPAITGSLNGLESVPVPAEAIQQLIADVVALNLKQGISNSLDSKLEAVLQALDDVNENNNVAAINMLQAFINAVEAQRGVHISDADADALIAAAQQIVTLLGG